MEYLAGQSNLPWAQGTWLGEGHTVPCDSCPSAKDGSNFSAVLLTKAPAGGPRLRLPSYRGQPVNLLWCLPITESERAFAMAESGDELRRRLEAAGYGWVHRDRAAVV